MAMSDEPKPLNRGIYLLPNLFTTAGLFAGFYSIVASMKGYFDLAAITIFVAMIMDSLDGRVARLTNTQSEFGVQYDSLSDMVAFGVAPALVIYNWSLMNLGKFGWLAAFLFAATVALRLARFNTQVELVDKRYFQGLPCPAGAGVIASIVWIGHEYLFPPNTLSVAIAVVTMIIGLLMVSDFRYYSFKKIDFKGKVPFFAVIMVVLVYIAVSIEPPVVLFVVFTAYLLSGPIVTFYAIREQRRKRRQRKIHTQ